MSLRTFNVSLYREHLDEVAGLAQLREGWLSDGESTPDEVVGLDGRIDAHVDALALGGVVALEVVYGSIRPEDPWSLYAWVAVACQGDDLRPLLAALAELERLCADGGDDVEPSTLREVVIQALIRHLPHAWEMTLARQLHRASPHVAPVLVRCIGARCRARRGEQPRKPFRSRARLRRVVQ